MLTLQFELEHQKINLVNRWETVAADSKNYLVASFSTISDDWTTPITAIFTNDKDEQPYAVVVGADSTLESNECYVPWEVLKDESNVYVSAYCGNLHTTVTAQFHVYKSGYADGETPPPPSPTVYDAIMEAITNLQNGKQDKLTAGENITISDDNVISAEGGGSQIVSGVVNANGTITFTDSDGNTFTTTGSSVIGADGIGIADVHIDGGGDLIIEYTTGRMENIGHVVGADGQDYVLTAQDKSDIANIVLSELPTTQGVLYGS